MEGEEMELESRSSVVRRSGKGRPRKGQVFQGRKLEWIVEDIGKAAGLVSEVVLKNGWRKI